MPDTLRVLYVDDDPGLLEIGKRFLEESGRFNVDIITSAPAALTLLDATKYDAIISDYQMPVMDGIGFLKSVRASGNAIPFILFTGRGREEIVIQALNEGANFYLQKGGEPEAQFAELVHKIQISVEHHRAAEKIQALNRLYSVLSATNKATFSIQTRDEFFLEICRILVETGGFRMAWIGLADLKQKIIRPVAFAGHVDGYLDTIHISTEDVPEGRGPTGTAFREGKYFWSNDITLDPRMEPWRENALKRGYLANAAFAFALGTKNAGVLSLYAPVTGFFDAPIIGLLEELSVDISFYLKAIDDQAKRKSAEEGLQQEQLFSKSVLDSLPGIFYLYTYPDCRLVLWNKQHEVLLGYETGEMKGRHVTDWHAPESKESVMNAMETVMKTGQGSMDAFLLTKDGHMMPFFLTGVRFEANGELYVMGIGIDVTERKQAEADLRASEEALSAMLNGITESAFLMTPEGTTLAANETVARRLGMKQAEDMIGQNALRLLPEDVQMSRQIKIKEVIQSGQPAHFEDVRLGRVISQTIYPVKDPDGTVRRLAIFGVDVTDRKLTEEALHETDARLRFALRSAKSGTWDWDFPSGKLVWSPEFFELFGLPPDVPSSFETWLAALHPDDRKPSMEKIDQSVKDHKDLWSEYRVLLPEGGLRWIGAAGSTSYNDQGEPLRMSGLCIDISERKQAEEALRESEANYLQVINTIDETLSVIDPDGNFLFVNNNAALNLSGGTPEDVTGKNIREFVPCGQAELLIEKYRSVVASGQPVKGDIRISLKSGERWFSNVLQPIHYGQTKVPAVLSISLDITERKRAEMALQDSNELFTQFIRHSPFYTYIKTMTANESRILYVSDTYNPMTGLSGREMVGKNATELLPAEVAAKVTADDWAVISNGTVQELIREYGGRHYNILKFPIVQSDKIFLAGYTIDITERKQAEEALRESEELLRDIIEKNPMSIQIVDREGFTLRVNLAFIRLFGSVPPPDFSIITDLVKNYPELENHISRVKSGEMVNLPDISFNPHDIYPELPDVPTRVRAIIFPLNDRHGKPQRFVFMHEDITEQKLVEEALRQANKKLNLLSSITRHDITNQLTVLRGYLTILEKTQPGPTLNEYFLKVNTATKRIAAMIQLTKEYEEIGVHAPAWQDCRKLVDTAARQAHLGQVVVKNDLPAGTEVFADQLINRVFYNLMDNAVTYGEKITTIRFSVEEHNGDCVIVCEDDGNGVPDDEKEMIFNRGFGKNTGLGLFLSREILSITDITISETGDPGKGARFEITVPKGMRRIAGKGT